MYDPYKPRKQKINPKASGAALIKQRMQKFLIIVERHGIRGQRLLDINLQIILDLSTRQHNDVKVAVLARHPDLVKWHKKMKEWEWIGEIPEIKPSEEILEKSTEITNE